MKGITKKYCVAWTYYGIRGAEEGFTTVEAESGEKAEDLFCEGKEIWKPEGFGYMVNWIEEVKE